MLLNILDVKRVKPAKNKNFKYKRVLLGKQIKIFEIVRLVHLKKFLCSLTMQDEVYS